MEKLLEKITSYNLFNYLFPGITFVYLIETYTKFTHAQETDYLFILVWAYFVWLVISRLWSLCVEPIMRKIVVFADYKDFLKASDKDKKIEILSEQNNMYRTIIAMLILFLVTKIYEAIVTSFPKIELSSIYIVIVLLIILFILSYRKQITYITKRIEKALWR